MSALYLIRHGQAGPRFDYDALSEVGKTQSRLLGRYLALLKIEFVAAYCGSLNRQRETAELVSAACREAGAAFPEIVCEPRWNEFDLEGVLREMSGHLCAEDAAFQREYEELQRAAAEPGSELHHRWTRCDAAAVRAWFEGRYPFSGESWSAFCERVNGNANALGRHAPGEAVAVFSSAAPISIWVGTALGLAPGRIMRLAGVMYNTAISTLRLRGPDVALFSFNTTPHLLDRSLHTLR